MLKQGMFSAALACVQKLYDMVSFSRNESRALCLHLSHDLCICAPISASAILGYQANFYLYRILPIVTHIWAQHTYTSLKSLVPPRRRYFYCCTRVAAAPLLLTMARRRGLPTRPARPLSDPQAPSRYSFTTDMLLHGGFAHDRIPDRGQRVVDGCPGRDPQEPINPFAVTM